MPQFPIPTGYQVGSVVLLTRDQSRHLKVLRFHEGDGVRVFDGKNCFNGRLVSVSRNQATVKLENLLLPPARRGEVVLAQALLKKDKMEFVVQKATELGVAQICPLITERTIGGLDAQKIIRWQKIADEALKQSGRTDRMIVLPPRRFSEILTVAGQRLIFSESGDPIDQLSLTGAAPLTLVVGPEGGFSTDELAKATDSGHRVIRMGMLTLRAETAALAALALIQHELGNI